MAKKAASRKKVAPGIARIIALLTEENNDYSLCSTGQARLKWWKKNQFKFKSVKAALLTWKSSAIEAWFDYIDLDYDEYSRGNVAYSLDGIISNYGNVLTQKQIATIDAIVKELNKNLTPKQLLAGHTEEELSPRYR